MNRYGYLWLLWLLSGAATAQQYPQQANVASFRDEIPLLDRLYHLTDSTGRLGIQQVIKAQQGGQFQRSPSLTSRQDFGYNETAIRWLFFELSAPANGPPTNHLMLEIEYANLDELELLEVRNGPASPDQINSLGLTGDRFQFSQRPYQNNNYVFPIRLQAGQKARYFLRVNQPHATLSFAMRLWQRPAFVAADRTEYFFSGIFIGIICIVLVLNMVMLVAIRDRIYTWYSLYLHFITMHLFADSGLGFQYLWPTFPRLNEFLPVYMYVWAAMVAQMTFMQYFIRQNRRNSRIFWWVDGFKWFITLALVAVILVQLLEVPGREAYIYQTVTLSTSFFLPIMVLLTLMSLYESGRRSGKNQRQPMVRYYGYALAVQFSGYGVVATMNLFQSQGWPLPFEIETYVIIGLTVVTDLIFFTYGLAYRYTQSQQDNQHLELNLLKSRQDAQQQVIHSLEDERQRLAQDLHDDIGPLLATAKGYVSQLARSGPSTALQQAQTLLDEAADELRTLSHQLLPGYREQISLAEAIAEAIRKLGRRGVPVEFVTLGQERSLDRQREQLLFSIATQLIRNARQRAQVTEVTVQLLYHDEQLTLSVEDNGPPANLPEADAANLRAKAGLLKAELLIDATRAGNSVMVSVSLTNAVLA